MAQNLKLHVPQLDGEIVLTRDGNPDDVRTLQVSDHIISARNVDERDELLRLVDGARSATPKESGGSEPTVKSSRKTRAGVNADAAVSGDDKPKE